MTVRNYINGAPLLTLSVAVNTTDVTLSVTSTAGYPATPFTGTLERGTVNEEVLLVTGKTSNTFTVTRGWDGTTGKNHSIGAAFEHTTAAVDYNELNVHLNDQVADVHPQYVLESNFFAKGRSLVGTGVGTFSGLAVGPNDTVRLADSAQATGQKWGTIVAASITDATITEAKLTTGAQQSLIARQAGAPASVEGREYFDTGTSSWYGYRGGWKFMTFGVRQITVSTAAPSGGVDGDVWLRY